MNTKIKTIKTIITSIAIATIISACGKSQVESVANSAVQQVTESTNNVLNNNSSNNTNNNSNNNNLACNKSMITGPVITTTINGHGSQSPSTVSIPADQLLKVKVTALSAIPNLNTNVTNQYTKMSMTIKLLKNGSPVSGAEVTLSNPLNVGSSSSIMNFSNYLTPGSGQYSIQISTVKTDYTCKTFCNETYYTQSFVAAYGYYPWSYSDYQMINSMVNSCKSLQCEVGPASQYAGWSVKVQIENDTSECLQ
jgi:hypothetical protein